jgi:ADP-dependent NAD(P)H-hydrate dehydratase / NAD(P)H-hydrate epimerase
LAQNVKAMMSSDLRRITHSARHSLHGIAATRKIEAAASQRLPAHTLMQRAGLSVAKLTLAIAPHARTVWIACGPGNNGGDGLEAAMHLKRWGKNPVVTWLGTPAKAPVDALISYQHAVDAGVEFSGEPPAQFDLCIDALLGIGTAIGDTATREIEGRMGQWIEMMNAGTAAILAVDLPTGLNADTGQTGRPCVLAKFTLSLLTLKPGLFTAHGRDASGEIWFDSLGGAIATESPTAWLSGKPAQPVRAHASHKGSFGDVAVIGGAPGMTGAALLAASAALWFGAGRVFVSLLDEGTMPVNTNQPELMFRALHALDLRRMAVVCGCGGGDAVRHSLSQVLSTGALAVIDADAINSIAIDNQLKTLLCARAVRNQPTVLTPHPLEAARLLGIATVQIQQDRLGTAQQLADRFRCIVVLKGSGTVIAAPGQTPCINPTGNARLATAGTGDVLAGMIAARAAGHFADAASSGRSANQSAFRAACDAVFLHGLAAGDETDHQPLTASTLIQRATLTQ